MSNFTVVQLSKTSSLPATPGTSELFACIKQVHQSTSPYNTGENYVREGENSHDHYILCSSRKQSIDINQVDFLKIF